MPKDDLFEVKGITKWIYDNPNRITDMRKNYDYNGSTVEIQARLYPNENPFLASNTKQLNKKLLLLEDV
jgi:hypothetical protein